MGKISNKNRSQYLGDESLDIFDYVELEKKSSKTKMAEIALPTPNPWGIIACHEVYILVWRQEYDYLPGNWLGFISMDYDQVYYSYLKKKYRKKGLGILMYELALLNKGTIKTDYPAASYEAKKVWDYLKDKYDHTSKGKNLTIKI